MWQLHQAAVVQRLHLLVKQFYIQTEWRFQIDLSMFCLGIVRLCYIQIVIIHTDGMAPDTEVGERTGDAVGSCGLAGTGGPGQKNNMAAAVGNILCNAVDLFIIGCVAGGDIAGRICPDGMV